MTSPVVGRFVHHSVRLGVRLAVIALTVLCGTTVAVASARMTWHRQGSERRRDPGRVVIRGQAPPSASVPTVSGPLPGVIPPAPPPGAGVNAVDAGVLAGFGYQEKEFFISGMANAYDFSQAAGADGRWTVLPVVGAQAGYRTRIVVFTPKDPRRFSGTVIVEWDNVSAGADGLPDLIYDHDTVFRDGDAYVGVSAQFVGVASAKANDPARYGTLIHQGDSYSYDIFSQAGMALWRDSQQVLSGLRPLALIADGDSKSATRLLTYVDAFAPVFNVYDGYLIHSRMPPSAALQQGPGSASVAVGGPNTLVTVPDGNVGLATVGTPPITLSRTDLLAPQLTFETQSDVNVPPYGLFGYGPATQADTSGFRLWEVAGTSHLDDCFANLCPTDNGDTTHAISQFNSMVQPPLAFGSVPACTEPINTGEEDYVLGAALQQLTRWVVTGGVRGGQPAAAPPLFAGQSVGETSSPPPVLDGNGDIVGGVRSPAVDVPVATLTGIPTNTPGFCILAGSTAPFTAAKLTQLYPTHGSFVSKWTRDVIRLTREGYLTRPDALNLIRAGASSSISR
jgi:hypothetical protein